ncbi:hypothetical protein CJA_2893 [Cellvibrio japonicus Ueda107]|uniref:Uncharacterized protein n=1 Tax=Cellvibrio japonicus (strain Ueda107) TaxID=498211 RepID=B3PC79_CELJU|nr:hypothetical protein CJA_2893 [Cellvibrio japonicus Ueda107]
MKKIWKDGSIAVFLLTPHNPAIRYRDFSHE